MALKVTYNGNQIVNEDVDAGDTVTVEYDAQDIATLTGGDTKTLKCNGKYMDTDVDLSWTGGGKTLKCADTIASADIVIELESASVACTITISGTPYSSRATVTYNGTVRSSTGSISAMTGNECMVHVNASNTSYNSSCWVKLNGETVLSGSGDYTFTLTGNCTISFARTTHASRYYSYQATITMS